MWHDLNTNDTTLVINYYLFLIITIQPANTFFFLNFHKKLQKIIEKGSLIEENFETSNIKMTKISHPKKKKMTSI